MTDMKAEIGTWDDINNRQNEKNQSSGEQKARLPFVSFPKSGIYKMRLIGKHIRCLKYWSPIKAITHPDYKGKDPAWVAGFYPPTKYAIHVIDRADGKLKLLEKGNSLFKYFANFKAVEGIDPAGKDAPDVSITVNYPSDGKGGIIKQKAEYVVQFARKNTPLTEEELKMFKEQKIDLQERYKSDTLEKITELWNALSDSAKIPPKKDKKESTVEHTKVADEVVAKDIQENEVDPVEPTEAVSENKDGDAESADLF